VKVHDAGEPLRRTNLLAVQVAEIAGIAPCAPPMAGTAHAAPCRSSPAPSLAEARPCRPSLEIARAAHSRRVPAPVAGGRPNRILAEIARAAPSAREESSPVAGRLTGGGDHHTVGGYFSTAAIFILFYFRAALVE
jgi:hypothetical protein